MSTTPIVTWPYALRRGHSADPAQGACAMDANAAANTAAANAADVAAWDDYFQILDQALNAGPQGTPWSADTIAIGTTAFTAAGGIAEAAN